MKPNHQQLSFVLLLLLFAVLIPGIAWGRTIVVFAPHPDDEALMASGIIYAAKKNGDTIKVVVATNGDCQLAVTGHAREQETIAAMSLLGLNQNDVIFLGYPDCGLRDLYTNYASPTSIYTSRAGFTQTYAYEGLGGMDYHRYIYGSSANYNKPSMILDIKTVLRNYNPQEIYVTSEYDAHPDHHYLYAFVVESMTSLMKEIPSFQPTLHAGLVHEPCELVCDPNYHWPDPPFTPDQKFAEPPYLYLTPLIWNDVESVPVPIEMQEMNSDSNLKYRAISLYPSQSVSWLYAFVKNDEIFWKTDFYADLALNATLSASSETTLSGATADRVADGSLKGEWTTDNQLTGWVQLNWSSAQQISRIILHDRTNSTDNVVAGTLTFSDSSQLAIGPLPSGGAGHTINFDPKSVTWIRFTIDSAQGTSAGLSEIEVYGTTDPRLPITPILPNVPPQITTGPGASPSTITDIQSSNLAVTGADPDGDPLVYTWSAPTGGSVTGSGASAVFTPPRNTTAVVYRVDVTVSDGRGGNVIGSVNITVTPSGTPFNVALYATATASSQNTSAGQLASKAIDNVVSGYPVNSAAEWAAVSQTAGAWITLTWNNPQIISRIILHDRINASDQIVAGTLQFSDGTTLAVGTLPNDGAAYTLNFPAKTITWVRFQATIASGSNTGLAEFEAY